PLVIEPLQKSYELQGQLTEFIRYLSALVNKRESISLLLALVRQLHRRGDEQQAVDLLKNYLQRRPSLRAMEYLLELRADHNDRTQQEEVGIVRDILKKLLLAKPVNRCNNCGFSSKNMHWQCPSCKRWNTVKPIHGIEGE
nr:lipopolysaccharide assembly protein LapB [Gammaproteobacteria bacterium]